MIQGHELDVDKVTRLFRGTFQLIITLQEIVDISQTSIYNIQLILTRVFLLMLVSQQQKFGLSL